MAVIVIVDDNVQSSKFMERLLRHQGHMTHSIATAVGAVETVKSVRPDLVLLDVRLADNSGIEVLRSIRQDPELQQLAVVMLSGVQDVQVQEEAFRLGALDYLLKGWNWDLMLGRIEQHLKKN
jgi:DNA-binding response OmpR family regulator